MTEPVRTSEPDRLTQGESVQWKRGFCDYPATEWTLEYRFRGPGTGFNVTASADGQDFDAVITSIQSAAMSTSGKYEWQAWATNISDSTVIRKIDEGVLFVERGFTTGSTGTVELRSTAKQVLDAIDATLLGSATTDQLSYEITTPAGTRKISKMARTELLAQRKYYAALVSRENAQESVRNGGTFGRSIGLRMHES